MYITVTGQPGERIDDVVEQVVDRVKRFQGIGVEGLSISVGGGHTVVVYGPGLSTTIKQAIATIRGEVN